jgi:hypothetical protein
MERKNGFSPNEYCVVFFEKNLRKNWIFLFFYYNLYKFGKNHQIFYITIFFKILKEKTQTTILVSVVGGVDEDQCFHHAATKIMHIKW